MLTDCSLCKLLASARTCLESERRLEAFVIDHMTKKIAQVPQLNGTENYQGMRQVRPPPPPPPVLPAKAPIWRVYPPALTEGEARCRRLGRGAVLGPMPWACDTNTNRWPFGKIDGFPWQMEQHPSKPAEPIHFYANQPKKDTYECNLFHQ